MPAYCIPPRVRNPLAPIHANASLAVGRMVRAIAASGSIGRNMCGYGGGGPLPTDPWIPGNTGRVVLTVSNANAILDDAWDFKIDGVVVCRYDGGGQTTVQFSSDLPSGLTLALSAVCVVEQNDNLFEITVTVDGVTVLFTDIGGEGTVGDEVGLGSFSTNAP